MTLRTIALSMILLQVVLERQQAAVLLQSSSLVDYQVVRDEWRRAYRDFKPSAAIAARIEEL
jgi:hypothetical protein